MSLIEVSMRRKTLAVIFIVPRRALCHTIMTLVDKPQGQK